MSDQQFEISADPDNKRYIIVDTEAPGGPAVIGEEVYVDYDDPDAGKERIFFHTLVSEDYGGLGLAGKLVTFAVNDAISQGFKIVPVCPYVKKWLPKHPEYAPHAVAVTDQHIAVVEADVRN